MKNSENTVPNIWAAQEKLIHFYRLLSIGLGVAGLLLLTFIAVLCFRDPIVVVKGGNSQEFYPSVHAKAEIGKNEVEDFTKNFLTSLYVWSDFSADQLAKEISPFAEEGLIAKVANAETQKYGKELKGKKVAQAITFIKIEVLDDRVVCRFDRVLKVEGIPLVIPTEVTLSMVEGSPTRLNPMGIYVSGITERNNEK